MEELYVRQNDRVQRREQEDCIGTVAALLKPRTPGVLLINGQRSRQDRAQMFPAVVVGNGSQTPLVPRITLVKLQRNRPRGADHPLISCATIFRVMSDFFLRRLEQATLSNGNAN